MTPATICQFLNVRLIEGVRSGEHAEDGVFCFERIYRFSFTCLGCLVFELERSLSS